MTQPTQPQSAEQMTEWLYGRAEEIFLLCCILSRRGLAHAFCDLSGHVGAVSSRVLPVDTCYEVGRSTNPIVELRIDMKLDYLLHPERMFNEDLQKMDEYIDWLEAVIEKGEALTTPEQAA
ncbi:MAG: hypothetical protein HLX50_08855 [Alteromonadaceae bacterium]|nr:hypothetical protein [Alteromonadaceae bacterium]